MKKYRILIFALVITTILVSAWAGFGLLKDEDTDAKDKLLVVWTSGDKDVAIKMVYMYTYNAKKNGWWKNIRFIVWGPSSKLLAGDKDLQDYMKKMMDEGVEVYACKACADMYGVSDDLAALGIPVKFMGVPLTEWLKEGWTQLTF